MRLRPDDAQRLLRLTGRLPKAAVTIAGGNDAPAPADTATDLTCASESTPSDQRDAGGADARPGEPENLGRHLRASPPALA
jgi:hypothetical protein